MPGKALNSAGTWIMPPPPTIASISPASNAMAQANASDHGAISANSASQIYRPGQQHRYADHGENQRRDTMHQFQRQFFAAGSPSNTAGTLASIMPSVVPSDTRITLFVFFAASATVAIWVLSPISAGRTTLPWHRKRRVFADAGFVVVVDLSGTMIQIAIGDERDAQAPAHDFRAKPVCQAVMTAPSEPASR